MRTRFQSSAKSVGSNVQISRLLAIGACFVAVFLAGCSHSTDATPGNNPGDARYMGPAALSNQSVALLNKVKANPKTGLTTADGEAIGKMDPAQRNAFLSAAMHGGRVPVGAAPSGPPASGPGSKNW